MTNASRIPVIRLLLLGVLVLAATSWAQKRPPISEQIAKTYGLDSFGQIERIRYTFNADLGEVKLSRTWVWEPKADQVFYEGKDKAGKPVKLTYLRSQLSSQAAVVKDEIDPAFINDQYWLLFPLHLVWDSSAKVEEAGMHKLPLGKGSARRHLGTLRWHRQPHPGMDLPPRRKRKADSRHVVGGLQEGRPSPCLTGPPRDAGGQAGADLLFGCVRKAGGVKHLGQRAINKRMGRTHSSLHIAYAPQPTRGEWCACGLSGIRQP